MNLEQELYDLLENLKKLNKKVIIQGKSKYLINEYKKIYKDWLDKITTKPRNYKITQPDINLVVKVSDLSYSLKGKLGILNALDDF